MIRGAQASLQTYDGSGDRGEAAVSESPEDIAAVIAELEDEMQEAAARLEFEKAAIIRDQIDSLRSGKFKKLGNAPRGRPGRAASSGRR